VEHIFDVEDYFCFENALHRLSRGVVNFFSVLLLTIVSLAPDWAILRRMGDYFIRSLNSTETFFSQCLGNRVDHCDVKD
jgi:hypothetical protein